MALVDDIRNEIAELIDSAEEIRGHAETYARQSATEAEIAEEHRNKAGAVIQRMEELLKALRGLNFGTASVEKVSALIESTELALDQADEALDELGL